MSLRKGIKHGKEHREEYYGSKRFDRSCRNHGSCGYCEGNRTHKHAKKEMEDLMRDQSTELSNEDWNIISNLPERLD
jgi:hypothetical protein